MNERTPTTRRRNTMLGQHAYRVGLKLAKSDPPFYALIAAACMKADSRNTELIKAAWPEVWEETRERFNAPGGFLEGERHG